MPILGIVIGEKFEHLLAAAQRRTDRGRPHRRRTSGDRPDLDSPDLGGRADEADRAFAELWRDANPFRRTLADPGTVALTEHQPPGQREPVAVRRSQPQTVRAP